jgi:hypothetical protein
MILRALEPQRSGDTRALMALRRTHLQSLRRELNIWRLAQSFTDQVVWDRDGFATQSEVVAQYERFQSAQVINGGLEKDLFEREALHAAWKEYGSLLKARNFVGFDAKGRLLISTKKSDQKLSERHSWKSLFKLNLMRSVTRLLMISYGNQSPQSLAQSTMDNQSLRKWYEEFNEIGTELKAFDKRSLDPGQRSFHEANFFTFSGNGDDKMSFDETFEFISFLFGAGLGSSTDIQNSLSKAGCEVPEKDIFDFFMFNETCYKNQLRTRFSEAFANLPQLTEEVAKMKPAQWDDYFAALTGATRVSDPRGSRIEMADLRTAVMVLHYVESLLKIYDKNQNQSLSIEEIEAAFPRFVSFLRTAKPGVSDANLSDAFAYMLFYGEIPSTAQVALFKVAKAMRWASPLPEAGRAQIIKVFQVLKADMGPSSK